MQSAAEIHALLRTLRRRMIVRAFLTHAARATLFFFGLLVVLRAAAWWITESRTDLRSIPYMLSWPLILGFIGGALIAFLRRPSLRDVALIIDSLGHTRDRLVSAFDFAGTPTPSEFQRLDLQDTLAWLKSRDFRPLLPIRVPRDLPWLVVPLLTLALLWWHEAGVLAARDASAAAAQQEVRVTTQSLDALARQIAKRAEATDDKILRQLAERLKQSAAQLRSQTTDADAAQRAALRELAQLEQLVKALRQPQSATPDELKTLAEALSRHDETKDVAKDMQESRFAEAARKLDQLRNDPKAAQAEQTLQNAIDHLARQKEQLSKQMEQLQAQAGEDRSQLLQQLSQLLQDLEKQQRTAQGKQPQAAPPPPGRKPMTDEDLKKLLGALQQLKDQQQDGEPGGAGQQGDQPGDASDPIAVLNFQQRPANDPNAELSIPSGQPGSERDTGTTKDPFAKDPVAARDATRQEQLKGELGEGESLSALIPAANAGDLKATRRFKELTEAAAASAEDAVLQENIPIGARFLIKRYFEAIRPKE